MRASGNTGEATSILEPLSRSSDAEVRTEAQRLLDFLSRSGATSSRESAASRSAAAVGSALNSEPEQLGSSRMIIGGDGGGGAANRDGTTIETTGNLPAVDEVLARYVQALGGAEAIKAPNSRVMKGRLDVAGVSRGGSFEIHAQAPNKMFSVMQAYPLGTVKVGYNGRTAWELADRGVRSIKGSELEALQRDGDFYYQLNLKQNFKKVTLLGKSKIGYREVYVLELQPRVGNPEKLFLNAETYLPVRMNTVRLVGVLVPGRPLGPGGRSPGGGGRSPWKGRRRVEVDVHLTGRSGARPGGLR